MKAKMMDQDLSTTFESLRTRVSSLLLQILPIDAFKSFSNDAREDYPVLFWVGCVLTVAFLAHFLNRFLCLMDTPVQDKAIFKAETELQRRQQSSDRSLGKKEFPWRPKEDDESKSVLELSQEFVKGLPIISWIISIFDFEGRRQRKWDEERRKWRELQQQLGSLRSIRAQRLAAKMEAEQIETNELTAGRRLSSSKRSTRSSSSRFPWKPDTTTNNSMGAFVLSFFSNTSVVAFLRLLMSPTERRKQKWDHERARWRELQQQLGTLRFVRAQRQAAGKGKCEAMTVIFEDEDDGVDEKREHVVATERRVYPWNEPDKTLSLDAIMEWVASYLHIFASFERRRQVKHDSEKEKWRELQQQLAKLRSIRAQRNARKVKATAL